MFQIEENGIKTFQNEENWIKTLQIEKDWINHLKLKNIETKWYWNIYKTLSNTYLVTAQTWENGALKTGFLIKPAWQVKNRSNLDFLACKITGGVLNDQLRLRARLHHICCSFICRNILIYNISTLLFNNFPYPFENISK